MFLFSTKMQKLDMKVLVCYYFNLENSKLLIRFMNSSTKKLLECMVHVNL